MEETKLEGGVSLGLSLILSLSDVHKLSQVMNGHLNIAILGVNISEKFVCLTLLIARALLDLTLADLQETCQTCNSFI